MLGVARLVLVSALVMLVAPSATLVAAQVVCLSKPNPDGKTYWRYRLVRGKKCWYQPRKGKTVIHVDVVTWREFNAMDAKAPPLREDTFDYRWIENKEKEDD